VVIRLTVSEQGWYRALAAPGLINRGDLARIWHAGPRQPDMSNALAEGISP